MEKTQRQYGLWDSPITPLSLSRGIGLSEVAWDESGALLWLERRADRGVIVVQPPDGQSPRDLNSEYAVRGRVGYGGGDFSAGHGFAWFAEASSGRLYRQPLESGTAAPLTPAFGAAASPRPSPDGRWLLYIHSYEGKDVLALADAQGRGWPAVLAEGHDFFMQPCWHPGGKQVAWVAWDHPNMPWDGTCLYLGSLAEAGAGGLPALENTRCLAGGPEVSIFQPQFSPDGRWLAYISDQSGWWQIYLYDLYRSEHHQLTRAEAEHGVPAWVQGLRTYAFAPDGSRLFFTRIAQGGVTLWEMDLSGGQERQIVLEGYTNLLQIAPAPDGQRLALLADGGAIPPRLIVCDRQGQVQVVRRGSA